MLSKKRMKVGDQVSILNDSLNCRIIAITANQATVEDEHGFTYQYPINQLVLHDADLYKNQPTFTKKEATKTVSKKHAKSPMVLDLHFENLVKNPNEYSATERLFLQKERLLETLDFCRQNNLKKLEIVHGIGDGTLQQMVYSVLESKVNLEFHNREILHEQSGTVLVYFK